MQLGKRIVGTSVKQMDTLEVTLDMGPLSETALGQQD